MKLTELTVAELLSAFKSSDPTPGGGSASALAGAVGAALIAMVAVIPKPRAVTQQDVERLLAAGARSAELSTRLTTLIDRDSEAYEMVVGSYRLPKTTDDEKAARTARIQEAMRLATEVPLEVMRVCSDAVEQSAVVAAYGNRNASSDVWVGLELLGAGLRGAKANVEINLASVKDADYVARTREAIAGLENEAVAGIAAARARLSEER